jgi:NADPH:quinone reductase-like Zn-dependent oxidoreductase
MKSVMEAAIEVRPRESADQQTMKAAVRDRYGAADKLRVREIARPQPGPDEVLVRVRASSVNSADWRTMRGRPLMARPMMGGPLRPSARPLGSDVAGVVEAVGSEVTDLAPGDEVYGNADGAFAEFVAGKTFVPKPANLSFEEAAALPMAACTALQAVRDKGAVQPGQRVLVNGAGGGVGSFAVQIAKAHGAHVSATSPAENVEMLRALGADEVIDYKREDFTRSGRHFDLVIDVGGVTPLRAIGRALSPQGRLVMVGAGKSSLAVLGRILAASIRSRLLGQRMVVFVASVTRPDLLTLKELAEQGLLRPAIDRRYSLPEVREALTHVENGRARGKVVISI